MEDIARLSYQISMQKDMKDTPYFLTHITKTSVHKF